MAQRFAICYANKFTSPRLEFSVDKKYSCQSVIIPPQFNHLPRNGIQLIFWRVLFSTWEDFDVKRLLLSTSCLWKDFSAHVAIMDSRHKSVLNSSAAFVELRSDTRDLYFACWQSYRTRELLRQNAKILFSSLCCCEVGTIPNSGKA